MPVEKKMRCKVCLIEKPKSEMRRSTRNRTIHHCKECKGKYRCIHCGEIKPDSEFKTHSHNIKDLMFDDGDRMRIAVCYSCDYKLNKHRYSRYDKRVNTSPTLKHFLINNFQRYRQHTVALGLVFDLTPQYLKDLWDKQCGKCFYTGEPIELERGKGKWKSASLDKLDPSKGYTQGNVVWTTRLTNTSKQERTLAEFIEFCKVIVANHG